MVPLFADIALFPGGWIAWIVVGLIAGFAAGQVMKGGGYGLLGDIVVGLVGAVVGGFLVGYFVTGTAGFVGSIVVSFIGACLFIALMRAISGRRPV
ncbi:MAG TPA: GlsB/YeaQ/YmgE family stress response membrane protein [Isosphaeraceae bacterium]|jgi:uncharacterized membrane protein YeaQ/YmgE (transglycosylase-associated protein family)|nr:GlsB/YeaQ/YmgE family stress response membrane protein [Isosphaeraceae bacterium]